MAEKPRRKKPDPCEAISDPCEAIKALADPKTLVSELLPENTTLFDVYESGSWHQLLRRIRNNIFPTDAEIQAALRSGKPMPLEAQIWLANKLDNTVRRPRGRQPTLEQHSAARRKAYIIYDLYIKAYRNILAQRRAGEIGIGTPSEEACEVTAESCADLFLEPVTGDSVRNIVATERRRYQDKNYS